MRASFKNPPPQREPMYYIAENNIKIPITIKNYKLEKTTKKWKANIVLPDGSKKEILVSNIKCES